MRIYCGRGADMATVRKLQSGNWNAEVRRKGFKPVHQTFKTKREAENWAH